MNTKINEELSRVFNEFGETYLTDEGYNKAKIIMDIENYDKKILSLILKNDILKKALSFEVDDNVILNHKKLVEILELDEYWQDSYTRYSKKIGLAVNGKFLDETMEVVLDFPYKDSVLKASMSKEDNDKNSLRSDEPFLNEIIAKEEIDTLFDKKILINAKRYGNNDEKTKFKIECSDNLIIKGNNLLALYSLKDRFSGKVNLIYIDVPYYFKKKISNDSFKYNSNFKLSTWLVFLKNRISIAKELLTENGTIWINISEDGMHYLKIIMDEIFGADKFVGTIPRKIRDGKSDVPFNFSQDFDWILVYSNGFETDSTIGRTVERKYYNTDDFPNRPWRIADLTKQTTVKERPNSDFSLINPKTGKEYPVNPKRSWAVTKDTFHEWYEKGGIGFPDDYDFMKGNRPFRRIFKDEDESKEKLSAVSSDFLLKEFITNLLSKSKNKDGNNEISNLFSRDEFDYAKPEKLIKSILEVATKEGDIVLDFFMGSGTTQAVAHKMNRQYIGIEQMDYIKTVTIPRLEKVIEGEQGGVSKELDWLGGGSFVYAELMEKNNGFLKSIEDAETQIELRKVFEFMMNEADIDFKVDLEKVKDTIHELTFLEQKRLLVKIIDKNQLYYNHSEINDKNVRDLISDEDYKFNIQFYENGGENL
ncbi:site-specific DNA-methyltransferase [Macrococcoides canis]|uniref:DNA methylase 1 n=1 Tax=Macrococcoides canis TaxID=1855823 RepID=A0A6G5ZY48_9STAP|nr:site-specific DNA-methyltransferase [Macrococcus canis]QHW12318.1 DNA methylase 1 [Macrococcus canis]QIH77398.1 site-specific DNA-methyltransferase [Macrococcus canis]